MADQELSAAEQAEILRKKQKYREWLRSGRIKLPPDRAAMLVGPDCLFHLYAHQERSSGRLHHPKKKSPRAEK